SKAGSPPEYANGRMVFVLRLQPKATWHTCQEWLAVMDGHRARVVSCNAVLSNDAELLRGILPPVVLETTHPTLPAIWRRAVDDMEALRMSDFAVRRSVYVPAAGIPWYVTLFGRDSLVVSMEGISGFPEFALGAIGRLAQLQAPEDDAEQAT